MTTGTDQNLEPYQHRGKAEDQHETTARDVVVISQRQPGRMRRKQRREDRDHRHHGPGDQHAPPG